MILVEENGRGANRLRLGKSDGRRAAERIGFGAVEKLTPVADAEAARRQKIEQKANVGPAAVSVQFQALRLAGLFDGQHYFVADLAAQPTELESPRLCFRGRLRTRPSAEQRPHRLPGARSVHRQSSDGSLAWRGQTGRENIGLS